MIKRTDEFYINIKKGVKTVVAFAAPNQKKSFLLTDKKTTIRLTGEDVLDIIANCGFEKLFLMDLIDVNDDRVLHEMSLVRDGDKVRYLNAGEEIPTSDIAIENEKENDAPFSL